MPAYTEPPADGRWGGATTLYDTRPGQRTAVLDGPRADVLATERALRGYRAGRPPRRTGWRGFVATYGWRAYALPILSLVTVYVLLHAQTPAPAARSARSASTAAAAAPPAAPTPGLGTAAATTAAAPTAAAPTSARPSQAPPSHAPTATTLPPAGALPPGAPYTTRGAGTFTVLRGSGPRVGQGPLYRYTVEVENGLAGVDVAGFAATVATTLADAHSWARHGDVTLQRVDSGPVAFRISLTSALTVRTLCGYELPAETSCYTPTPGPRVVLNVARWVRGAAAFPGDLPGYRIYMVNHEVGHAIGHQHETACRPDGRAPVMMQQTLGLTADGGAVCRANPWPYPAGG